MRCIYICIYNSSVATVHHNTDTAHFKYICENACACRLISQNLYILSHIGWFRCGYMSGMRSLCATMRAQVHEVACGTYPVNMRARWITLLISNLIWTMRSKKKWLGDFQVSCRSKEWWCPPSSYPTNKECTPDIIIQVWHHTMTGLRFLSRNSQLSVTPNK